MPHATHCAGYRRRRIRGGFSEFTDPMRSSYGDNATPQLLGAKARGTCSAEARLHRPLQWHASYALIGSRARVQARHPKQEVELSAVGLRAHRLLATRVRARRLHFDETT